MDGLIGEELYKLKTFQDNVIERGRGKTKKLYWTPCRVQCIDLMLEDFEKKISLYQETLESGKNHNHIYSRTGLISLLHKLTKGTDLVRPSNTCFATF